MAVGYVLGARAGDKRYKQITSLAERALDIPAVNRVVESGRDFASDRGRDLFDNVKSRAFDSLGRTVSRAQGNGES